MRRLKYSDVEWIGEIPQNWNIGEISKIYIERIEKVSDKDFKPLSVTKNGVVPQLENVAKTDNGDNRKLVMAGDFVINSRSDRRGSCGISSYNGSVSLINIVLKPRENMNSKYYNYVFKSERFADEFYKWGNGIVDDLWSTKWSSMKRIYIPVPSISEQEKIANYLDKKVADIEDVISKTKKSIEEYKKYKQSIITEVVTKGLNIVTKSNNYKNNIEVPENWKKTKIKYVINFNPSYSDDLEDSDIVSFVPMECIGNGVINQNKSTLREVKGKYTYFSEGDIVIAKVTPCFENGNIAIARNLYNEIGFGSSELYVIRCINIEKEFMFYFLQNNLFKDKCVSTMTGTGGLKRVSAYEIKNYEIYIPPVEEQKEIVNYLDLKCIEIDKLISKKQEIISELENYKKSLIYECVTGKKEV